MFSELQESQARLEKTALKIKRDRDALLEAAKTILRDFKLRGFSQSNFSEGEYTQDYTTRYQLLEKAINEAEKP